jgi:cell division protein FtsL
VEQGVKDAVRNTRKKAAMSSEATTTAQQPPLQGGEALTPAQRVRSDWRSLVEKVSYRAIVNNIPFLAFIVLLCVLYITNSQRAIEMQRELNAKNKELKELRWKYVDVKSQLMYVKTETQVMKSAEKIGLKPALLPAYKITPQATKGDAHAEQKSGDNK